MIKFVFYNNNMLYLGETSAMDATTTICHRYTPPDQLAAFTKTADIIVSAAGTNIFIATELHIILLLFLNNLGFVCTRSSKLNSG